MEFSVRASLEQFTLDHPSGDGRLKISIALPSVPTAQESVPVLYVVDGDFLFGLAAEIMRAVSNVEQFPACYVVGVGYDASYADFLKMRTADLSPPIDAQALNAMGSLATAIGGDRNGGANAFLAFLVDVLRPAIAERYPQTREGEQILFGHSLGGLFAAHALLTRPEAFSAFIVSSPSLWWNSFAILRDVPALGDGLAELSRRPRVFVGVGGKEEDLPTSVPEGFGITLEEAQAQIRACRMVDTAKEFADALREAGVGDLRHIAFAEDDHTSAALGGIIHGMRFALGCDQR